MEKIVKTLTLAVITFRPAAYPRLQCYWGNQPLPEVSWELESKVPLPKTEKSANLAHFFESGHILRIKNPMSNLRGSRSGLNYFLLGKLPSNFQGSKSWWGKFPHFPQWWIRPWFRQLCFELNPESPFFFYTSIHLDENMSNRDLLRHILTPVPCDYNTKMKFWSKIVGGAFHDRSTKKISK